MRDIKGTYSSAIIHTDNIENYTIEQVRQLCNQMTFQDSKIRIMPDAHPGKVGPIGFTATITDKVMPAVIGIDIGCGVTIARIRQKRIECQKLDAVIRERIPSGCSIQKTANLASGSFDYSRFQCLRHIREDISRRSMGSLGGGNHFIEIDKDTASGELYIVIHTGSRSLGKEVAEYYLSAGNRQLSAHGIHVPYELTFLEGELMEAYLHDMKIAQEYAAMNRKTILGEIVKGMKWKADTVYDCVHNFISMNSDGVLTVRKGAISAELGEQVVIPINMKDGVIIGIGKGNSDWNYSAPHGAGRIAARQVIRNTYTVSQFKKEMQGIYSSCISRETLDEAPFAYRSVNEICEAIKDTVKISKVLVPVYNYKAGGQG